MKYLIKTENKKLNVEQAKLQKQLGISNTLYSLLLGRGLDEKDFDNFLHPNIENLSSPFSIGEMKSAAERIQKAIKNKERILIYGDYDCDGICAISILVLCLKDKTDVNFFIPDRSKDGYGLTKDSIDSILEKRSFDLLITVDCGITSHDEVEYLKSKGIDVIITDHHEPQEIIPDCIVVDPKINKQGFYDLCGAGVAFKLVEALAGRKEALNYIDIAAIATIADVVPLLSDNRIIAYYGIKSLNKNPRKGIKMLYGEEKFTSGNIMFKLAPKINAAGRLHSAMKVVDLFVDDDYFMLKTLADDLQKDNTLRQELCEKVANEAFEMLKGEDFNKLRLIVLYNPNWEPGVLGIAAARLVEEFKRPTILFATNNDGEIRGSARSVKSVNIFNLLTTFSNYFSGFGGHAQAAGVNMKEENLESFKKAANEYLLQECSNDDFIEELSCEMELPLDMDFLAFAKELELLEPTGYCNPKPNFKITLNRCKFEQIGYTQHMKYNLGNLSVVAFSKYAKSLGTKLDNVSLEVNLGINSYQNLESAQAIVQSSIVNSLNITKDECYYLNLHHFDYVGDATLNKINSIDIDNLLSNGFGTLFVCFSEDDYRNAILTLPKLEKLQLIFSSAKVINPENAVVICPSENFEYSYYQNVIVLGNPLTLGYLNHIKSNCKNMYVYGDVTKANFSISDELLRNVYQELYYLSSHKLKLKNFNKVYLSICSRIKISFSEFAFAYKVLEQLDLVTINDKNMLIVSRKHVDLNDSQAYLNMHN